MGYQEVNTLIFDAGDTLIRVDPRYSGKMKNWPELHALQGAAEVLRELSANYRVIIASNAEDSDAADAFEAMRRLGLHTFIEKIFTVHELSARKPERAYYSRLFDALSIQPQQAVMIGDDYQKDILPAVESGIHTIWFNAHNKVAAAHLPLQEAECEHLAGIPAILEKSPLPDYAICLAWYAQLNVSFNLIAHVNMVAAAAYRMAVWLRDKGESVSPLLAHRGGLLHDLAKFNEKDDRSHADLAAEMLESFGQPELARIAGRHLINHLAIPETMPETWEEKVVNYCDKLTEGSSLVTLDERLEALKGRYPDFAEKIRVNTPLVKALEKDILTVLGLSAEEAPVKLRQALYERT